MKDGKLPAGYRLLLALFPPAFRRDRGRQMGRLFLEMRREWEVERGGAGARFWALLTWDAVREAGGAWLDLLGDHANTGGQMGRVLQDVRFGLRQLVRRPLFGGTIVALVAIGIAGNTAVFRIFNGLFLRPLPFPEPQELVNLDVTAPEWDLEYVFVSIADYRAWLAENSTFQSMAAYFQGGANLSADGAAQRASYLVLTHTADEVLGVEPVLGRFFTPEEDVPDAPRVALLSHGFWTREFARDPGVVGTQLRLDGEPVEVIGVLPPSAAFLGEVELWMPLREDDESSFYLTAVGRLLPGVAPEAAQADLRAIHAARVEERSVNASTFPVVASLRDRYLGDSRRPTWLLFGAVGIVLLIACANIAGLMFARALGRAQEVSVRRALGASRGRLVRQLLTESLVLAGAGGVLGAILGFQLSELLLGVVRDQLPSWVTFEVDPAFVAFVVAATGGAALVFGLLPAVQATKRDAQALARGTASLGTRRGMHLLVGGQVALAAVLLVLAGLVVQDVRRLSRTDPGFEARDLMTYRLQLPQGRYPEAMDRSAFVADYRARLAALPGVESAVMASILPLMGHSGWFFEAEAAPGDDPPEESPVVLRRFVTVGYHEAMGVRLLQGRGLEPADDREDGVRVAVVNETFVRTHLQGRPDPVGARIRVGGSEEWITVVGVARDVKHYGVDRVMRPATYEPLRRQTGSFLQVGLRTTPGGGAGVMDGARALTAQLDPEVAPFDVAAMETRLSRSLLTRRATAWLTGGFALAAVLLAIAGLYGVISYTVGQRAREIGIRMAMGAGTGRVGLRVVGEGMRIALAGVVVGLGAAAAVSGVVREVLVASGTREPGVFLAVGAGLLVVAALANYLPARRASRLSPMATLRSE